MNKCVNCGIEIRTAEAICSRCGYVITTPVQLQPTKSFRELYKANLAESHKRLESKHLTEALPGKLQSALDQLLLPNEVVDLKLRGAFKEVLICTDRRVIIMKTGFMTGQFFGTNIFQLPYSQISSAQVEFHLASGFFQLSAGGMLNLPRSYWSKTTNLTPRQACNCISVTGQVQAKLFRDACTFIMDKISSHQPSNTELSNIDPYKSILELGKLLEQGLISQAEFDAKKNELMARM